MASRITKKAVALMAAGVLVSSGLAAVTEVGASSAATGQTHIATSHTSRVRLRASTSALPHSSVHRGGGGAVNLTEDGKLQRFANRSHSARPKVVRAGGRRVLARGTTPSWLPEVAPSPVSTSRPGAVKGWEGNHRTRASAPAAGTSSS
jgi:hypothetical protein